MKLFIHLDDPNEQYNSPIKMASAIIDHYTVSGEGLMSDDEYRLARNTLDEIADHIKAYVTHWPMEV